MRVFSRFFVGSAFWVNFEKVGRLLGELGLVALLARFTDKHALGSFQLMLSLYMVAYVLALTGHNAALLKALSGGYDGTLKKVVKLNIMWGTLVGGIIFVVGGVWYFVNQSSVGIGLILTGPLLPFYLVWRKWEIIEHAKEKFAERALTHVVILVIVIVVIGKLVIDLRLNIGEIFFYYIAVQVVGCGIAYLLSLRHLSGDRVDDGWRKMGYKLYIAEIFGVVYGQADKIILASWLGLEKLAIYSIAIKIGEGVKLLLGNMFSIYIPRLYRQGTDHFIASFRPHLHVIVIMIGTVMVGIFLLTPALINLMFSDEYYTSIFYARLYLLIIPFHLVATVLGQFLINSKLESDFVWGSIVAGAFNLLIYMILIPIIGTTGAIVGSVGYYVILSLMHFFSINKRSPSSWVKR